MFGGDSGCYFFMHNETGETRWDHPKDAATGKPVDVQPSYADLNEVPPVLPLPSMMLAKQLKDDEPCGVVDIDSSDWDAIEDKETGQTYYYNGTTGEASWSWPPGIANSNRQSMLARVAPDEWQILKDSKTGAQYYFRASDGASKWV